MAEQVLSLEDQLAEEAVRSAHDPIRWCMFAFDWDRDDLKDSSGPRKWQRDIMGAISAHLRNPSTRYQPCRIAVASGHGIGKSALVAMLIHWAMSTAVDTKIVVTANTGDQLSTKTVPEVAKWFRRAINAHWWEVKATSIKVKDHRDEAGKIWRTDFNTWSEENTDAFQGAHNQGKRLVIIFDEASAISDRIWEVTEGALTDEGTEIIWLAFGNPTKPDGRFRECFAGGKFAHRWHSFHIDSRTVEGTNRQYLDEQVADWGEDHDWVRVRVRGEFPRTGATKFISPESVHAARNYKAEGYETLPAILAVDVARFGDDRSVIGIRQGRKFEILAQFRGLDTVQLAERTIEFIEKRKPDAWIIDGIGVGAGVVDQLRVRGYDQRLFEYAPSTKANDFNQYYDRRTEIWGLMRDWLEAGAQIPNQPDIAIDLTAPDYFIDNKGKVRLESKDDMKARGVESPDIGDCLAMTFQEKILKRPVKTEQRYVYPGQAAQNWMG